MKILPYAYTFCTLIATESQRKSLRVRSGKEPEVTSSSEATPTRDPSSGTQVTVTLEGSDSQASIGPRITRRANRET